MVNQLMVNEVLNNNAPIFIITIDTEGDNIWGQPSRTTTRNAKYIYRFHELCVEFGQKPTYLTNYEMANCQIFRTFGREVIASGTGEIGMHLHAWNTPPLTPLTSDDNKHQPFLIEYTNEVMKEKIHTMTGLLEDVFGTKMVSHRAGRWGFDERYAKMLIEEGYLVDASVTPLMTWENHVGDPLGNGGTNYINFPQEAYRIDPSNISRAGRSPLLEVPVSTIPRSNMVADRLIEIIDLSSYKQRKLRFLQHVIRRIFPEAAMLRPNGKNIREMLEIIRRVLNEKRTYAEFMLHSSEFMPGGSPYFQTEQDINRLFTHLRVLFKEVNKSFVGATLEEFYSKYIKEENRC